MRLSRRQALMGFLGGSVATFAGFETTSSGLVVPAGTAVAPGVGAGGRAGASVDAYEILQRAIRTRSRIRWGGTPAHANSTAPQEISVITIKVMNQICPPLVFRLGTIQGATDVTTGPLAFNSTLTGSQSQGAQRISSDALAFLESRGISELAPAAMGGGRYRALRFNRWFANLLDTGMVESTGGTNVLLNGVGASDVQPFPTDVAIQAVLGVNQSVSASNHDFNNCGITGSSNPAQGGDLAFHLSELGSKLVPSPLGIVCFNAGSNTETDSGSVPNRVLGSDLAQVAVGARSVGAYVSTLEQATALGLVSFIDDDLTQEFDKLANPPTNFPLELKNRKVALQNLLGGLRAASGLESTKVAVAGLTNLERGALQDNAGVANDGARMEFIAQCKFVQLALDVDQKPFRNFSLYCHVSDIDGASFDKAVGDTTSTQGLSYIEGMRQLAVGLNILARAISKHKNVYVVVVSEGGRDFTGSDNDVALSLVLGPAGGPGDLKDQLYAPEAHAAGAGNAFVEDPGNNTSDFRQVGGSGRLSGAGLLDQAGAFVVGEDGLPSANKMVSNNEILIGLVRHIEKSKGLATPSSTTGLGRYLKLAST